MLRLLLDVQDLADARFTISPLHETVGSLWPVYHGRGHPVHNRWARQVRSHPGLPHELLSAMISPRGWIPDFLAPPPDAARPSIAAQLAQVRATPPARVLGDVVAAYGPDPLPDALAGLDRDPADVRDQVAGAVGTYWELVIAPHWPRIQTLLESDLMYRGHQLAQAGHGLAFDGLDHRIRWQQGTLTVNVIRQWRRELPVAGRGLRLVPSLLVSHPYVPVNDGHEPVVSYPARRAAVLWEVPAPPPPGVARALLGRSRSRLLALLDEPASTTDLAVQLGVTPSAVSQHLRVLAAAGLVDRDRVGRAVLYRQTESGARLAAG